MVDPEHGTWALDERATLRRLRRLDQESVPPPPADFVRRLRTDLVEAPALRTTGAWATDADRRPPADPSGGQRPPIFAHRSAPRRRRAVVDLGLVAALVIAVVGGYALLAPTTSDDPGPAGHRGGLASPAVEEPDVTIGPSAPLVLEIAGGSVPPLELALRRLTFAPGASWELPPPSTHVVESGAVLLAPDATATREVPIGPGRDIQVPAAPVTVRNAGTTPAVLLQLVFSPPGATAPYPTPEPPPPGVTVQELHRGLMAPLGQGRALVLLDTLTLAPGAELPPSGSYYDLILVESGTLRISGPHWIDVRPPGSARGDPGTAEGTVGLVERTLGPGDVADVRVGQIAGRNLGDAPAVVVRVRVEPEAGGRVTIVGATPEATPAMGCRPPLRPDGSVLAVVGTPAPDADPTPVSFLPSAVAAPEGVATAQAC